MVSFKRVISGKSVQSILFSMLFITVASCSGGGGNSTSDANPDASDPSDSNDQSEQQQNTDQADSQADNSWTVGQYQYVGGASAQQTSDEFVAVSVSTTGFDRTNGLYSGAALALTITNFPAGIYAVTNLDGVIAANESGAAAIAITVTTGTINTDPVQATSWDSVAATGTAAVSIDGEGRRTITIADPITLERGINLGDGLPGGDQLQFTMTNISGDQLLNN